MTGFADYQRQHLLRERAALASRPPAGSGFHTHAFHPAAGATPAALGEAVLRALTVINLHVETCPAREVDMFDDAARERVAAFWREKLPAPLAAGFAQAASRVDPGIDWERMSGSEIAAHAERLDRRGAPGGESLFDWMTGFAPEARFWFYAGHEIRDDALLIGVEMSEDAGIYTLEGLVERCGGRLAAEAPGWLSRLVRALRP